MIAIFLLITTILLTNCATASDSLVDDLLTQSVPSKNMRIGIIGAGAAGLSAAYYLKQNGYNNVIILERDSRVGGKCHSVTLGEGETYELGAILIPKFYKNVRELATSFREEIVKPFPFCEMSPTGESLNKSINSFSFWEKIKGAFFGLKASVSSTYSMPDTSFKSINQSRVSDTCAQFINSEQLHIWERYWRFVCESLGYGLIEKTPAAYVLRMFPPKQVEILMFNRKSCNIFQKGYQALFEKMAQDLNVKTNQTVTQIAYDGPVEAPVIHITTKNPNKDTSDFYFDRLIVAIPPDHLKTLTDLSESEKTLFSKIRYYDYGVTLFEPEKPIGYNAFIDKKTSEKKPVMLCQNWPDNPIVTSYAYGDLDEHPLGEIKTDGESINKALQERTQELFQTNVKKIHAQKHWEYFPHVTSQDIKDGWFDQMEALQGVKNTYYVGSAMSFELVETVVTYSKELVNKHFPAIE